ncbi:hypothetical protein AB0J63_16435 [Streptosporangium canum]|uniref:hypothetical protein n=1 Tax=Streptosporangium canum TaxID=324952 RepID=UPI0034433E8E
MTSTAIRPTTWGLSGQARSAVASLAQIAGSGVSCRKAPAPSARRTWKVREVPPWETASTISSSHRAASPPARAASPPARVGSAAGRGALRGRNG